MSKRLYLVDKILPTNRVHLFAGISSAGKSRFLIPTFIMWSAGLPVFGLKTNPVPWCIVCRDRPEADITDMIDSIGFAASDVRIIPAFGKGSRPSYQIIDEIHEIGARFVVWEGFDMMVKNPNDPSMVAEFLSEITAYCEDGITVLGTMGVAKLKPSEMYQNPRQLVAGSTIWERCTSTNFVVVPVAPKDLADNRRLLYVSLKNAPSFQLAGQFDENGILTFDDYKDRGRGAYWAKNMRGGKLHI